MLSNPETSAAGINRHISLKGKCRIFYVDGLSCSFSENGLELILESFQKVSDVPKAFYLVWNEICMKPDRFSFKYVE